MKNLRITILAVLVVIVALGLEGCKKETEINDNYYVRYEVYTDSGSHYGQTLQLSVNTDSGVKNYETKITHTGVSSIYNVQFGPLDYGFITGVKVTSNPGSYSWSWFDVSIKIYVSKNTEPFVLKSEVSGTNECETSYVIDY